MDVELNVEESKALENALRTYTSELRMEIVDTDNPAFRRGLREERSTLESVLTKLDDAVRTGAGSRGEDGATEQVVIRMTGVWLT